MNSIKTTIVCVVLLGVLYGMYQVINTPAPNSAEEPEPAMAANLGNKVDPSELDLLQDDPDFSFNEQLFDEAEENAADSAPPLAGSSTAPNRPAIPSDREASEQSLTPPAGSSREPNWPESWGGSQPPPGDAGAPATRFASAGEPRDELSPPSGDSNRPAEPSGLLLPGREPRVPSNDSSAASSKDLAANPNRPPAGDFGRDSGRDPSLALGSATGSPSDGDTRPADDLSLTPRSGSVRDENSEQAATRELSETWMLVEDLIADSYYRDALALLSGFYEDPMLTEDETHSLQQWLDALAGKVIYSMEPHLELPHVIRADETPADVAQQYQIPENLLYNINRDRLDEQGWKAGVELKVVPGPFRAVVNLSGQRITLWLQDMYAGSMSIRMGSNPTPPPGTYRVAAKSDAGRVYLDDRGNPVSPMTDGNPYGQYCIDLGNGILLHEAAAPQDRNPGGCVLLDAKDAKDLFDILSRNSEVRIIR